MGTVDGRPPFHRTEGDHGRLDPPKRHLHLSLHPGHQRQLPTGVYLSGILLPERHVRGLVCVVCDSFNPADRVVVPALKPAQHSTPEVFPAPNRGTGTGIASLLNRIAGLLAPIIGANVKPANPVTPIYVSGGLFLASSVAMYVG